MIAGSSITFGRIRKWLSGSLSADDLMLAYSQAGNERIFNALYEQYADKLYYFIVLMSNPELASDVAQKTWMKVIEKRASYYSQNTFQAWLYTLARRTLIDELRKQKRLVYDSDLVAHQLTHKDEALCENTDEIDHFHLCIQKLPFKQKEALSLQLDGFSLQDIANICNSPIETIKTRLRYARSELKLTMKEKNNG